MHYFFISSIWTIVTFLAASYAAAWRIIFLDDCCVNFARRTTIGSSVLVTCNLIGATVWSDVLFIYSALDPEDTWMEAAHAWVFVVKLGGLRGGSFVFKNLSLMVLPADILKASHDSTKTDFMWWGENVLSYNSESTHSSPHCINTSFWHLGHYNWAGRWWSCWILEKWVGCFCT